MTAKQPKTFSYDVFLSINVGSMKDSALLLKSKLEEAGLKVWICVEMVGGDDFRDEIVKAVKSSRVFLPLINEAWASSGECKDEFNLAKRLNLTSHEKGITKKGEERIPILCPVAFSDLNWDAYPHVELLAANTNFIVHNMTTLNEDSGTENAIKNILQSLKDKGLSITLAKPPIADTLKGEVKRAAEKVEKERPALEFPSKLVEGKKYFGITTETGNASGYLFKESSSKEFTVMQADDNNNIVVEIDSVTLNNLVNDSDKLDRNPPLPGYLREWMQGYSDFTEICTGSYDPNTGLLRVVTGEHVFRSSANSTVYPNYIYQLVVFDGYIAGPFYTNGADSGGRSLLLYQF